MFEIKTASLALFMALLTLLGCGRQRTSVTNPEETFLPLTVLEGQQPEIYPFGDERCQASETSAPDKLNSVKLQLWHDGEVKDREIDLKSLQLSGASLNGPHISQVTVNSLFERQCDATNASPPECRDQRDHPAGWFVTERGQPLKICSADSTPPRKSLEHVGLAAAVAVEKSAQTLEDFIPEIKAIAPLEILAMPRFDTRWSPWFHNGDKGHYLTHVTENLAYFPESPATAPFIAVFPKSTRHQDGIYLWESEFVLAHEFAHHVERKLGMDRFGKQVSTIRLAASEAFADSLAFASQNASSETLKGIPCVGQDRDPSEWAFTNGVAKIIDEALISRLGATSSQSTKDEHTNCQGVLPQSAHGIGTILAHWLHEFAKTTPVYDREPGRALAHLTVTWLDHLNRSLPEVEAKPALEVDLAARSLEVAVEKEFSQAGVDLTDNTRLMLCQKMTLAFPFLKDRAWFKRTDC
jgi:hypothetical protein